MNRLWRRLTSLVPKKAPKSKPTYPVTYGFRDCEFIARKEGAITDFDQFPGADCLNIIHANHRTTVIRRPILADLDTNPSN